MKNNNKIRVSFFRKRNNLSYRFYFYDRTCVRRTMSPILRGRTSPKVNINKSLAGETNSFVQFRFDKVSYSFVAKCTLEIMQPDFLLPRDNKKTLIYSK